MRFQNPLRSTGSMTLKFLRLSAPCFAFALFSTAVSGGDCPCQHHSASARGAGLCSMIEDQDRCRISFSESRAANSSTTLAFADEYIQNFDISIDPNEVFKIATSVDPGNTSLEQFRAIFIGMLSLTLQPDEGNQLKSIGEELGIKEGGNEDFLELHKKYQIDGCFEYVSKQEIAYRFMADYYLEGKTCF